MTYTLMLTITIQYYSNKKWNENQFLQVVLKNQIKTKNKLTGRLLYLSDPSSRRFDCDNWDQRVGKIVYRNLNFNIFRI